MAIAGVTISVSPLAGEIHSPSVSKPASLLTSNNSSSYVPLFHPLPVSTPVKRFFPALIALTCEVMLSAFISTRVISPALLSTLAEILSAVCLNSEYEATLVLMNISLIVP